jgi:DNA-binding CsgD family transcriptional regulator
VTTREPIPVKFAVDDDYHAGQLAGLMQAMGYLPARELADPMARLRWKVCQMRRNFGLEETSTEVLERILDGNNEAEIAQNLGLSAATVTWRLTHLLGKIGAANTADAIAIANRLVA